VVCRHLLGNAKTAYFGWLQTCRFPIPSGECR
jgi:hypothetical protein